MRTIFLAAMAGALMTACSTAGSVAVGTVKAAGGAATSVAVGGAKMTAKGVGAGASAIASAGTPAVAPRTLAHRTSLVTGEEMDTLAITDIYTDGPRTDFRATAPSGAAYRCFVVELDEIVSDAMCVVG
ncbi:MAG: hypothetical protein AAGK23_11475 [Pseudomonadota bacterium]